MKETLMPRRRARAFAAGVALALLATLAACGDDPSDAGEPAGGGTTAADSQDEEGAATTAAESADTTEAAATTEGASPSSGASTSAGTASTTTVTGPPASTAEFEVADFAFLPEEIEITAGGEVIWINNDDFAHQIVATDSENPFPGDGTIDTDETYAVTFAEPGKYDYFCGIHNSMTGSIAVI